MGCWACGKALHALSSPSSEYAILTPPSHQDYVYQPFHDVLPYSDFSLTLRVRDVPQLLDLLKAVPYDQLMQYRRSL